MQTNYISVLPTVLERLFPYETKGPGSVANSLLIKNKEMVRYKDVSDRNVITQIY